MSWTGVGLADIGHATKLRRLHISILVVIEHDFQALD
jgi:hypothetical protein